jgi:hypothetical protein
VDGTVSDGGQSFIVGYDHKGLSELVAKVEEQLMQFFLVLRIQRA